jgi:hypothetical protein
MKKLFLVAVIATGIVSSSAFAEQKLVQCDSKTIFSDNTCEVCYEDTATATGTGNTVDIKDVKIPWKNVATKSEVIYKLESKQPEIISTLTTATTPTDAKDVWKFTNPWTGSLNEFVLATGKTVNFVETNTTAKITVTDKTGVTDKTVLIKSPLVYHERNTTTLSEDETPKTRNTCVLYAVTFGSSAMSSEVSVSDSTADTSNTVDSNTTDTSADTSTTDTSADTNTTTDTTSSDLPADPTTSSDATDTVLNSAPEEKTPSLNSAGTMPNKTSIETGPAENIFFFVALLLSTCIFFFQKKYFSASKVK